MSNRPGRGRNVRGMKRAPAGQQPNEPADDFPGLPPAAGAPGPAPLETQSRPPAQQEPASSSSQPSCSAGPGGAEAAVPALQAAVVARARNVDSYEIESLIENFGRVFEGKPPEMCLRTQGQKGGQQQSKGRTIIVESNMFSINLPNGTVHHYDVEISPMKPSDKDSIPTEKRIRCASTVLNRKVMLKFAQVHKQNLEGCLPAFDGRKNMYLKKKIKHDSCGKYYQVQIEDGGEERDFLVKIKYAAAVSFTEIQAMYSNQASSDMFQSALAAADIILRAGPTLSNIPVGRSFFTDPGNAAVNLGGGLNAWQGFYTSIRLGQWKPLINFDMSTTAFYKPIPVLDFVREVLGDQCLTRGLTDEQRTRLQKQLWRIMVTHTHLHPERKHRIESLSLRGANRETFEYNGQRVTVADYFASKYRHQLRYPNLPCIVEHKGNKIPMEVCIIARGQHCRKKLSETQTSTMIRATASDPKTRFQNLIRSAQSTQQTASNYLKEFGMSFTTQPIEVKARVLEPPRIKFHDASAPLFPKDGGWRIERNDIHFTAPARLNNWAVAIHGAGNVQTDEMINAMMNKAKAYGMQPSRPQVRMYRDNFYEGDMLADIKKQLKPDITLVVLGNRSNYSALKMEAETTDLCMRTQCLRVKNVGKAGSHTFAENLLLKINTKCGGTNWRINPDDRPNRLKRPYMVVGADVNHPAPGDVSTPSVASIVASMDPMPSKYYATTSVQMKNAENNRIEFIVNLKEMFLECLEQFKIVASGRLPEVIYFYRDGVSEGQLDAVRYHELAALRAACLEMGSSYTPSMTFIVVQKRHHVRFKPKFDKDCPWKTRNVPPGTVVDTDVVHPKLLDFYLCSHLGPLGTSVPAHYHVVHDDADHTLEEIQRLSYFLCYAYARCYKAVSIPAPIYYAHWVANRAKEHIKAKIHGGAPTNAGAAGEPVLNINDFALAQRVCQNLKNQMYFI